MDFKVAGTFDGITACQMDIKIEGFQWKLCDRLSNKLAKDGSIFFGIMNEVISEPRPDLSPYAPRLQQLKFQLI
jgi:polyribonucleotide nucleotidyltransferase